MQIERVFERLRALASSSKGVYLAPACSEDEIRRIQEWLRSAVGFDLPEEYEYVLRLSNGLQISNDYVHDAADFHEQNLDLYADPQFRRYALLGYEGNIVCWAYNASHKLFVVSTIGVPDEVLEEYSSFADLLNARIEVNFPAEAT